MAKFVLSTKTIRWMPEREWRLITPNPGPARYRSSNCAVAVYLGPRMPAEQRRLIQSALKPLKIPVWIMKIDEYEMAFRSPWLVAPVKRKKA
jgi:hypothetical protein